MEALLVLHLAGLFGLLVLLVNDTAEWVTHLASGETGLALLFGVPPGVVLLIEVAYVRGWGDERPAARLTVEPAPPVRLVLQWVFGSARLYVSEGQPVAGMEVRRPALNRPGNPGERARLPTRVALMAVFTFRIGSCRNLHAELAQPCRHYEKRLL